MPGKPFQSKLNQYFNIIKKLREEGFSYKSIAGILKEQHGIIVSQSSIHSFVKVRSKKRIVYTINESNSSNVKLERWKNTQKEKAAEAFDFDKFIDGKKKSSLNTESKFNYDENKPIK